MENELERRFRPIERVQIETRQDGGKRLVGHIAVFNQLSEDLGGFREQVAPGAFAESLDNDDIRGLFNHDSNYPLGRMRARTMELEEDARGLMMRLDLPDTTYANDLATSIERGDVDGGSFSFRVRPNGQNFGEEDDGQIIRTLTNVRLFDVGPVTFPAYPQTDVSVRSFEAWKAERAIEASNAAGEAARAAGAGRLADMEMLQRQAMAGG